MKKVEIFCYACIAIIIVIGVIVSLSSPDFFEHSLTVEDGIYEWLTVIMLLTTAFVMFRRVVALRKKRTKLFLLITGLGGLLMIFGAGEEVAWGQRMLGLETPQWAKDHNTQEDITLHNLKIGDTKINKLVFSQMLAVSLVVYLLILPPLYERKPGLKAFTEKFAVPLPTRIQILVWILAMAIPELIPHKRKGEVREACSGFIVFATLAFPRNRYIYDPAQNLPQTHS